MVLRSVLTVLLALSLASCATVDEKRQAASITPDFSKAQPVLPLAPPPPPVIFKPAIENDPLENVYVSMDAVEQNLSSVLYMVAAETGLNLIIGPEINVSRPFTLTVKNMPAKEALGIVCDNAGVGYKITGNTIRINAFVTKIYKIPYTTVSTDNVSNIGGDIFGTSRISSGLSGEYTVKYTKEKNKSDLHASIIEAVNSILFPETDDTTQISLTAAQTGTTNSQTNATSTNQQNEQKSTSKTSASDIKSSYYRGQKGYSFNIVTGTLRVTAPPNILTIIDEYIDHSIIEASKQVLIEAKIMEVTLTDSSEYGIKWTSENGRYGFNLISDTLTSSTAFVGQVISNDNLFKFIASQGKVESLGNPRIRVLNGQSAIITSGQLEPYLIQNVETSSNTDIAPTVTYERITVLNGISLGVTANILSDNTIALHIVPVLSNIIRDKEFQLTAGGTPFTLYYPIVDMKEAGTILTVKNGSTIVMGGLITNKENIVEYKIPVLGDIPALGMLFKSKSTEKEKRELVIMITTTLIDGNL